MGSKYWKVVWANGGARTGRALVVTWMLIVIVDVSMEGIKVWTETKSVQE